MSATLQVQEKITLLPSAPHSENGPAQQYCLRELFNENGQLVWQKSPRGFINYFNYDPATGTLRQKIEDVNLALMITPPRLGAEAGQWPPFGDGLRGGCAGSPNGATRAAPQGSASGE